MTLDEPVSTANESAPKRPDRLLHVMLRVRNLDNSVTFYTERLGMKQLHRNDFPKARFTIAFLGYGEEESHTILELTHNWDEVSYEIGTAYGHIALPSEDIYAFCAWLERGGVKIVRKPGPMKGGPELAFVEDPDGYKIELIQRSIRRLNTVFPITPKY